MSNNLCEGKKAPAFNLPATGGKKISLAALKGKQVVLYFYPRDNTPGCTSEGQDFRDHYAAFVKANTEVLGISCDSLASHEKFSDKQGFPFALLSDEDGAVSRQYDVIKMKNMYGKQFEGIERSTFLIGADGKLLRVWRKVKVPGHVAEVLAACR